MQLAIGNYNTLTITKETPQGLYLASSEGEILLPGKYIPPDYQWAAFHLEQALKVFVYTDSEDRLVATTLSPKATADSFAALEVKDTTQFGAFLDWGLEKDLLLPFKEQAYPVRAGDTVVVRVMLDHRSRRVIAVSKIESFFDQDPHSLQPGQPVTLLVYGQSPLGYKVVVDQQYGGMVYQNEVFQPLQKGDTVQGFVKKIREDHKLDISLQKPGFEHVLDAKAQIMFQLRQAGGQLPYHDKSAPEDIEQVFNMSKKTFKKAIGGLYKEGKISIEAGGITTRI